FFFSSRRRHTRSKRDWSSDVCSSDLMNRHIGDGIACEWGKGFRGWRFRDIRKVVLQIAHLSPRTRIIVKEAHGSLVSVSSAILPPRPQPRAATAARGGR